MDESLGDAVAQSRREDSLAVELQVLALFEVALFDQEPRSTFLRRHAAPNFGHQQAYVVVHAHLRTNITGGGHETVEAGQHPGDQGVVEVNDGGSALNGPLVNAPSEPAPVVEGDLPVMLQINS